jgi:hypothetical protein
MLDINRAFRDDKPRKLSAHGCIRLLIRGSSLVAREPFEITSAINRGARITERKGKGKEILVN